MKKEVRFQETSDRCQLCDKDGHTAKQCPTTRSKERQDVNQTSRHDVRHQRQGRGRWNRRNDSFNRRRHHHQRAEQDPTSGFENVHNHTNKPARSQ